MKFDIGLQTQAYFKLAKKKIINGVEHTTFESKEFPNLVLDQGISRMVADTWNGWCHVGSGNSTPIASNTQLDNFVASTQTRRESTTGFNVVDGFIWMKCVYRFNEGTATGNLAEVATGWGATSTQIWNRSLIKDINGDPTTITVLSDEVLDVYVEYRMYLEKSITGAVNLVDKNNNLVSSHTYTGQPVLSGGLPFSFGKIDLFGTFNQVGVYTGGLPAVLTGVPTGILGAAGESVTRTNTGLGETTGTIKFGLDNVNGVHRTVSLFWFGFSSNNGTTLQYLFELNPTITLKNNTRTMRYTFKLKVDRYTGV